jgi:hypothetical protein
MLEHQLPKLMEYQNVTVRTADPRQCSPSEYQASKGDQAQRSSSCREFAGLGHTENSIFELSH